MQRSGLVILLALVVLAGLAARTVVLQPPGSVESATDAARLETAHAFYDAWNDALAGAPIDPLGALLSPLFVEHVSETGATQSGDAFLAAVRATQSALSPARLEVLSIEAAGGNVTTAIRHVPAGPVEVAGLKVEQALPAPHTEVLRIERGKIVDRWAPGLPWIHVFESTDTLSLSHFTGIDTTLARVSLVESTEHTWLEMGLGMLVVESGVATLRMSEGATSSPPVVLEPGSFAKIPHGARVSLRPVEGHTVSVLIYSALRIGPGQASATINSSDGGAQGGSRTVLWNGRLAWSQSTTIHRAAQIVLPVGGAIELVRPQDTELLAGIDTGAIEVGIPGGSVTMLGEDRWPASFDGLVQADASHAVLVSEEGIVFVRNLSETPVTLTLISVQGEPPPSKADEHSHCPSDSDQMAGPPCFIE